MAALKTKAAIAYGVGKPWAVQEIEVLPPQANEVLVRIVASGLCHSDYHALTGDVAPEFPTVGGHEGSGIIEAVGPGVTRVEPGDHIVFSFVPSCGVCRFCASGMQNLCDDNANAMLGLAMDGTYRARVGQENLRTSASIGTFRGYGTVPETMVCKVPADIHLEVACLVGCGVPTCWGSAVNTARIKPGDVVAVIGVGGIGMNAVQGARMAGASAIVAVDTIPSKAQRAYEFGATHHAVNTSDARSVISDLTRGVMADSAILTVGLSNGQMLQPALDLVRKGGVVVATGLAPWEDHVADLRLTEFILWQKELRGSLYGACNPQADIPRLLGLYRTGQLKLDELITNRYSIDDINLGYEHMLDGTNIRGIIVHEH